MVYAEGRRQRLLYQEHVGGEERESAIARAAWTLSEDVPREQFK
jgi:hypothetical protein